MTQFGERWSRAELSRNVRVLLSESNSFSNCVSEESKLHQVARFGPVLVKIVTPATEGNSSRASHRPSIRTGSDIRSVLIVEREVVDLIAVSEELSRMLPRFADRTAVREEICSQDTAVTISDDMERQGA